MIWLQKLRPGPHWESLQRSPKPPCWNKQYFIWDNYRNAPGKAILNICCLHYAQHAFPGLKSIKNFGSPTLRLGPLLWMLWRRTEAFYPFHKAYIAWPWQHKHTFIEAFRSVPGCQPACVNATLVYSRCIKWN